MSKILTGFALLVAAITVAIAGQPATAEYSEAPAGPGREAATRLANGEVNTCVILDTEQIRCWGDENGTGVPFSGNVGDDETPDSVRPVDLGDGRTVDQIAVGANFACAILDNSDVRCWGSQLFAPTLGVPATYQSPLGSAGSGAQIGDDEEPTTIPPVDVGGDAVSIATGGRGACVLLTTGDVQCWGGNDAGQVGIGDNSGSKANIGDDETPASAGTVDLGAGNTATAITAGRSHYCAILQTGDVRCWGTKDAMPTQADAIGDDEPVSSGVPADLGGDAAVAISGGDRSTCALTDNDDIWCWGIGRAAATSTGDDTNKPVPVKMNLGGNTPVAITLGYDHACFVNDVGQLYCWGDGGDGRLGYGNVDDIGDDEPPLSGGVVDVGAGRTVLAASAGGSTTCALLDNLTVRCWGEGGIIGAGTTENVGDDELPGTVPVVNYTGSAAFTPLSPARIADTRLGNPTGILAAGQTIDVQVTGEGGVPDTGVYAAVLNVAMANPTNFGFVTAWPKGEPRPTAANLNVQDGNASNSVIVPVGDDGKVSMFSSGGGHLIVDVFGYFEQTGSSTSGRLIGVDPSRVFDTRPGLPPAGPKLKVDANDTFTVDVTGTNNVPETGVSAVVMNITAVNADGGGFVTVYPDGQDQPTTANINVSTRTLTRPNTVIMPVGTDGRINIFTSTSTFLVGDVFGYFTDDTAEDTDDGLLVPVFPTRLLDTRELGEGNPVPADDTVDFAVTGQVGIPSTANAVIFNLAGVNGQPGFVTAYPNEITRPGTANLNVPGPTTNISNLAVVPLDEPSGRITLYSEVGAHLVVDTAGYFL